MPIRSAYQVPMDVRELLDRQHFVVGLHDLISAGVSQSRVSRLVRSGALRRLARGTYTDGHRYDRSDVWIRFEIRSRAFAMATGPKVALSGWSAATVGWKLPTMGRPPRLPEGIRMPDSGRGSATSSAGRVRVARVPQHHIGRITTVDRSSVLATDAAWTIVDLARALAVPDALVLADHAARRGVDLAAALPAIHGWPGVARAHWVVEEARTTCESPNETVGRIAIYLAGLPMPVFNAWVGRDTPQYRVDFLWPWHYVFAEADGAIKYNNRPDAHTIIRAQYEREWDLQQLDLSMVRFDWDLATKRIRELSSRFATVLDAHPVRPEPIRWWKDDHGTPRPIEPSDQPDPGPTGIRLPAGWSKPLRLRE